MGQNTQKGHAPSGKAENKQKTGKTEDVTLMFTIPYEA